jgi:hypothetical protein
MPDENKKEDLVDVGEQEGADINLDSEQTKEKEDEKLEVVQDDNQSADTPEKSSEQSDVQGDQKQKTEKKEDELEQYSDSVKRRIAKLTRKMREAERQRQEAITFAQSMKTQKEKAEARFAHLDKDYMNEFESRVKTSLDSAKIALKNAIDSGDVDAQVAAQQQIASLTMDSARLQTLKSAQTQVKETPKEVNITPQRQEEQVDADPKAEAWATKNAWFGNDSAMTYTAFDIHNKLVREEGYDPKSDEYYAEIDKRIRLEFPHKFDKVESITTEREVKPTQTVASARRPATTGRKKTVRLTPSQVAIAKKLGVPLEDYARQLQLTKEV